MRVALRIASAAVAVWVCGCSARVSGGPAEDAGPRADAPVGSSAAPSSGGSLSRCGQATRSAPNLTGYAGDGGAAASPAASASAASPSGSTAAGLDGDASACDISVWYEAEAIPPNVPTNGAHVTTCSGSSQYGRGALCAPSTLHDGALCCSGGKLVQGLAGRAADDAGAGIEFHDVFVPSDGSYDVTWWYHCGANDHAGDNSCGGVHYPVGSSCRPHLIDVNGIAMTCADDGGTAQFYQFPCYAGDWSIIHAATTTLPLKAGDNRIYIHPPHDPALDAVDIDVIHVTAVGQGTGPTIVPVVVAN